MKVAADRRPRFGSAAGQPRASQGRPGPALADGEGALFAQARALDECPECGGYWLDPGELRTIRSDFETDEARRATAEAYFTGTFGSQLHAEHAQTEEQPARVHKGANMFRFICPSYFIPGKQDWGPCGLTGDDRQRAGGKGRRR
jgi:Zn-finger nucleic acid-binding protein